MTPRSVMHLAVILLMLASTQILPAWSSHFRGAIIQWSPADPVAFDGTIVFTHRIAWRRSYISSSTYYCDANTIASEQLIGGGSLVCRAGCSGVVGNMQFQCTDFSVNEDWTSGQRTYTYNMSGVDYFEASYTGNAWISLVTGGNRWEVRVKGNLTSRSDTGRVNTSPITAMPPILKLKHGCNYTIDIPTDDIDGDQVRCRWANYFSDECGGVCNAFPDAVLNQTSCQLRYEAFGNIGWYAVALQIEDFTSPTATVPLSSVPVQFLVSVFISDEPCSQKPEFVGVTRVGGSCIGVPFNTTFHEPVIATSGSNSSIVAIDTVSPQGLSKSSLADGPLGGQWHVNITWTPDESQFGPNIFCYTAKDDMGLASDQLCVTLLGGVEPPNFIIASASPTGQVFPNHTLWSIQFDKQIMRPKNSRFVRIFGEDGNEVVTIDVAVALSTVYPEGSLGREVQFTTSFLFTEGMQYYVQMDPGVAVGPEFCRPESPALRDPNAWVVSIADITPPTLMFLTKEQYSSENFTINWNISEDATATCTLQTPTTQYTVICNNETFSATHLEEGLHFLFVQITDLAGNSGKPAQYGWTVDLIPPTVMLTSFPSQVSNVTEWTFMFECADEQGCTFVCSAHEIGQLAQYSPCETSYHVDSLLNEQEYAFKVVATDGVGNVGQPVVHQWMIDMTPPVISTMDIIAVTVPCGEDLSPNTTGMPQVTDNEDPHPTVEYEDRPSVGCQFQRLWRATDEAGNTATSIQIITLSAPQPPMIIASAKTFVPCSSVQDAIRNVQELDKGISVDHPCDRPVEISFSDLTDVDRCGFSFLRTWMVEDDCGESNTFQQTICILDQQIPDAPENGQFNTDIYHPLRWPQWSDAFSYEVYIWQFGNARPTLPAVVTPLRHYQPVTPYPPGTKMSWQVQYRTDANLTIPSPVWGFETEVFPDLAVTDIKLPPFAFSGQNFELSWTVINIGNLSSHVGGWHDGVRMGLTQEIIDTRLVATVQQRRVLDSNDGYISQARVDLRNTDIGTFYVFVEADIFQRVDDFDRSNNRKTTLPIQVRLTPPPNLEVMDVRIPQSTFSGESVIVSWTVENTGSGITATDQWFDRVYWSDDEQFDAGDTILGEYHIMDALAPGTTYTQSVTCTVPKAIFGDFFIIVGTDIRNHVYEHNTEDDNSRVSDNPIEVTLSPPPDLIVSALIVGEEYSTGSQLLINYTVTNNGAGAPFETFWTDKTVLTDETSGREIVLDTSIHYGTIQPGDSYTKEVQYFVSANFDTGQYNLSIHTDVKEQVFEFQSNNNNMLSAIVRITQHLADLTVSSVEASLNSSSEGNTVRINYTVVNMGSGPSIAHRWIDTVGISDSMSLDGTFKVLAEYISKDELFPDQSYSVELVIDLTSSTFGELYIHVITDNYNRVQEEGNSSNRRVTGPISVPLYQPDLAVISVRTNYESLLSGDMLQISWTVANVGNGTLSYGKWTDSVYVTMSTVLDAQASRLNDYAISYTLEPTDVYNYNTTVNIPNGLAGVYYLFVKTDNFHQVDDANSTDNNANFIRIFLDIPASPDLVVKDIVANYGEGDGNDRILIIQWTVVNVGNGMTDETSWIDRLFVSREPVFDRETATKVLDMDVFGQLDENQEYVIAANVLLPMDAYGSLFVYAEVDSANDILELSAEDNNIGRSHNQVSVQQPVYPQISVEINNVTIPSSAYAGEKLSFQYNVLNAGDGQLPLSSWTDGVYLVEENDASRDAIIEDGFLLATIVHNRAIQPGEQFQVLRNISIPYLLNQRWYFAVVIDINSNFAGTAEFFGNRDIFSQTSKVLLIEQGPLPDLVAFPPIGNLTAYGGQPINISVQVGNIGNETARGVWYGSLYLSRDALLDPFDMKLKTIIGPSSLDTMTVQSQTTEIFVPYDLPSANYYLFYEVDVGNRIPEEIEVDNNIAREVFTVLRSVSTDIVVMNVSIIPKNLSYEDDLTAAWSLHNTGIVTAEGYKCDTVYLSEDDVWDVMDHQLGETQCDLFTIYPYNGNDDNSLSFQMKATAPFVAPQTYTGIVRSSTNIRELNVANNVGRTHGLNIQAQTISLNSPTFITLQQGQNKVYRIDGVPAEETLVATLKGTTQSTYHDLFLRHDKPPTGFDYDAFSQRALSVDQKCVVRSTRYGTYYLRIESSTSKMQGNYSVNILVKIAEFEILEIVPSKASPLGNVTLLFSGTVIGYAVEAYLYRDANVSELYSASRVYWFSNEEVYATFNITGFSMGVYTVRLVDSLTGAVAELASGFEVASGIPGQASLLVTPPRSLRAGENGQLVVHIQNAGNTDIVSPLVSLSSGGRVLIRLLQDDLGATATSFQSVSSSGPAGILPPGSSTDMRFELMPSIPDDFREEFLVSIIPNLPLPHAYLSEKSTLRPVYVPEIVWDTIWDNALIAVGLTWASFQEFASDVVTQMSLVQNRKALSSDDVMEYALKVADGLFTARVMLFIEDISSDDSDMPLPLVVQRYYSSYISKRRTSGPCGKGWLLAWWELHISQVTQSYIELLKDRELVVFKARGNESYVNGDSQITIRNEEVVYSDTNAIEVYIFNLQTGQLARIENVVDESFITVQYNARQQPVLFRHSNGDTMSIIYSDNGLLKFVDIRDPESAVKQTSSYVYDSSGTHLMAVEVSEQSARYQYNEYGDLIEIIEATQERRTFLYDDRGLLVEAAVFSDTHQLVSSLAVSYDWSGLVTMILQPENRTLASYIDPQGRPKSLSTSPFSPPMLQIDLPTSEGRMLAVGNRVLLETRMDVETNALHLKDGKGNELVYELGESGEIISLIDSGGQRYGALFDAVGVRELVNPDGTKLLVDYGIDGHVSGLTNPDQSKIAFAYDSEDNLISKVADGVESSYEYDSNRRLTRASNDEGTVEIAYSAEGVPIKVSYPNGRQLTYGYNAKFQRVYIADNNGYNVSYHYNDHDQLAEIQQVDSEEWIVRFTYSVNDELTSRTYANGAYTRYEYDPEGRLLTLKNFNNNGTLLSMYLYEYDLKGQIASVHTLSGNWSFSYDAISQLTAWENPAGEVTEVRYDSRGNRLSQSSQGSTKVYSISNMNQYLSYGESDTFTYDMNGNLKQKTTYGRTESYTFDSEGRLTEVANPDKRCSYKYDALGSLYHKVCSDGTNYAYLVDPFGPYGPDIIAEISGDSAAYFVHSMEHGLLASFAKNRQWYYQFNGDSSVVCILNEAGEAVNSYDYDPFGQVTVVSESVRNIFQYVGQLGVIIDEAVKNVYMMRARHYDATHGKFISLDPLGFAANTPNLYVYGSNNPLVVKDPRGEAAPFIVQAVKDVALYATTRPPSDYTAGGFLGAVISGAVPIVGDVLGSITEDLVDRGAVNWNDVVKDSTLGAASGYLAKKVTKLLPEGIGILLSNIGKKAIGKLPKWFKGPLRSTWNTLKKKGPKFLREPEFGQFIKDVLKANIQSKIKKFIQDFIQDQLNDLGFPEQLKNYWMGFLEWISSLDPNDIIGPSGYGDANFIPANVVLEYKIRFENDPNATAPAQRVFITHPLDDDLDERSFRVGSFGFGDFRHNVTVPRAFLQDVVNVTKSHGVLVRVRAGIDVVTNEATWELQSIDAETGEAPVDPTVGFLPPNNGTTGQGFVTFTVRAKQQLGTLPIIDATASIIFDQNEPIDTPPIFNTIDNVVPTANVTVIQNLTSTGTPAVRLKKFDVGSGVAAVDLYLQEDGQMRPLLQGVKEDTAILPILQGFQYDVVAIAVDNVGNKQALEDAVQNVLSFNITVQMNCLNDCSGRGRCSIIGTCICESGFYGSDCSRDTPPLEPPLLNFTSLVPVEQEDDPVAIHIFAKPVRNTDEDELIVTVFGLPATANLSKGYHSEDGFWKLIQREFGDLSIRLPIHFSGMLKLQANAYFENHQNTTLTSMCLNITIEPIPDTPRLMVKENCYNASSGNIVDIVVESGLVDMSGTEMLSLAVHGLPEMVNISSEIGNDNSSSSEEYILMPMEFEVVYLHVPDEFQPFSFVIVAYSTVITTMVQANISEMVVIRECGLEKERVCPQITEQIGVSDFTFNWPATDASDIAIIQCPCRDFPDLTKDLFAVKECGMGGDWLQTEFSTCVSKTRMTLCEGGNLAGTLFDSPGMSENSTPGDAAILFNAASTFLTNENINNDTVRDALLDAFDRLLATDEETLLTISETTDVGERLLSSFDKIGEALHLIPEIPFMVNRTRFTLDFVELTSVGISDGGYDVTFGREDGDHVKLPKSLFSGNVTRVSSSQIKRTPLFRGRDDSITIASNIVSINVLEKEAKALTQPVIIEFTKIAAIPNGMEISCRFYNKSAGRVAGTWSKEGCSLLQETQEEVICACHQLSSFALIVTTADATTAPPVNTSATPVMVSIVVPIIVAVAVVTTVLIAIAVLTAVGAIIMYCPTSKRTKYFNVDGQRSQIPMEIIQNVGSHEAMEGVERDTPFAV